MVIIQIAILIASYLLITHGLACIYANTMKIQDRIAKDVYWNLSNLVNWIQMGCLVLGIILLIVYCKGFEYGL